MGDKEINEFLTHLAVKEKVSASTQNQALGELSTLKQEYTIMARSLIDINLPEGRLRQLPLLIAIIFIVCDSTHAQVCFRGRPIEKCSSFFLTEFGARYNTTRNSSGDDFFYRLTVPITLGWMKNVGLRNAFGGTIGLDPDTEYSDWFFSFGPRYRYWLSHNTSLDGMVSFTVGDVGARNINIAGVWMLQDIVGMDAGIIFDMVHDDLKRERVRPYVGVRIGSYPGLVACAVTAIVFAIMTSVMPYS
jgi:hypothetical protein